MAASNGSLAQHKTPPISHKCNSDVKQPWKLAKKQDEGLTSNYYTNITVQMFKEQHGRQPFFNYPSMAVNDTNHYHK